VLARARARARVCVCVYFIKNLSFLLKNVEFTIFMFLILSNLLNYLFFQK